MVLAALAFALMAQVVQADAETLGLGVYQLQVREMPPLAPAAPAATGGELAAAPKHLGWGWYAFAGGGQLADAVSTTRFRVAGQEESNRRLRGIVDRPVPFYSLKVGVGLAATAAADVVCRWAERKDGRRWYRHAKKIVPVVMGAWGFAAAIDNERDLARWRRTPTR